MNYIKELRELVGIRPKIMAGACVILIDEKGRLLLQQRTDNGLWGLPGGSMEPGENMKEVASRELFEEVGLEAEELELLDIFSGPELYYRYPHGDEV
ncbi:ADP-ribose pyrophosphatase, partial [Paenibacillus polymyxa]